MITRPIFEWLMSQIDVERLGWVLVHSLWQFAVVALLAATAVRALRGKSAGLRYGVLVAAMAVAIAVPVATWALLPVEVPSPMAGRVAVTTEDRANEAFDAEVDSFPIENGTAAAETPLPANVSAYVRTLEAGPTEQVQPPTAGQPEPSWSERSRRTLQPWLAWIVVVWSMGVVVCSARPLFGWHVLRRLRRVGVSPVPDNVLAALGRVSQQLGLPGAARLLQSSLVRVPIVVGFFRPVILLPVSLVTSIPIAQLEAILAHELAHVRRHDFVVNIAQAAAETLFFYHPAVWWISHQIRIEREHCCDDIVVNLLGDRVEYGRALVAVEQLRGHNTVLALSAGGGSLLSRIRRLASGPVAESRRVVWCGGFVATLACAFGCTVLVSSTPVALETTDCARVDLPDGSTVGLLGVTSDGTDPARWWSADGKPLDGHPLAGHRTTSQPDWGTRRRFAVRSTGAQRVAWFFPGDGQYQSSGTVGGQPDYLREEVIAPLALPLLEPITIECGVGEGDFGPWSIIGTYGYAKPIPKTSPELAPYYQQISNQSSVYAVEDDAANITLTFPAYKYIADQEWVIVAKDGQRWPATRSATRSAFSSRTFEITFSVPPDGVDHFEFRLRPYRHWVTFENVSLQRRQKTEVKVATAPPRPEAHATSESDPKDGASQRPPFVVTVLTQRKRDKKQGDELRDSEPGLINEGGDLIKGCGTGIVIDERGYIATMRHLVRDARTVRVMLSGNRTCEAKVIGSDTQRDIAVLKIESPIPLEIAKIGTSSTLKKSDSVTTFDNRQGPDSQAAKGSVTELGQLVEVNPQVIYSNLIQTDIHIDPAQSGGPLMNASDEVVGILVALRAGTQTVSFALPIDDLLPVFRQLVEADAGTASNEKNEPAQDDQTFEAVKEEAQRDIADDRLKFKLYGQLSDPDRKLLSEQGIRIVVLPRNITSDDKKRANVYNQEILDHIVSRLGAGGQNDFMRAAQRDTNQRLSEPSPDDRPSQEARVKSHKEAPIVRRPLTPTLVLPDHWIVQAVGFDKEGKELVTASNQSFITIRRWDVVGMKLISEIKLQADKHGRAAREGTFMFSGDRRRLVAATDEYVGIWETATGKLLKQLPFKTKEGIYDCVIDMLDCTPDLSVIVGHRALPGRLTLSYDANVFVWDGITGNVLRTVIDKGAMDLKAIDLSTDGKRLVTASSSGAKFWETSTGQLLRSIPNDNAGMKDFDPAYSNLLWSVQFSPDGKQLAMGDILGVKLLDTTSGKLLQQLEGPYRFSSGGRPGLVFSKDGQLLARLGTKYTHEGEHHGYVVPIWSTRTGAKHFELHTQANNAAFSDEGQRLAVASSDMQQALSVWSLNADAANKEAPGKQVELLQGEWALKAWQEEGAEEGVYASADELKGKKLLITGNVMSGVGSGIGGSMSFRLNSEKTPNEIDLTILSGQRKGITEQGIYKLEGDQLRICFGGTGRPQEFATPAGSGRGLLTLQREPLTAWGKEVGGLQAGLSISNASDIHFGGKATVVLKMRNVSNAPITASAWPLWLIKPTIVDGTGEQVRTTSPSPPGFDLSATDMTLKSGQTVVVAKNSIFVVDADAQGPVRHEGVTDQFTIHVRPGRHSVALKGFLEGLPTVATGTLDFEVQADKQEKPDAPATKPNNGPATEEKPPEPAANQELPLTREEKLRVLIDKVLAAHGGEDKLKKVTSFTMTYKYSSGQKHQYFIQQPMNFRLETTHPDQTTKQIVIVFPDGRRWWTKEPSEEPKEFVPTGAEITNEFWPDHVKFFGPRQVLRLKDANHKVALLDEEVKIGDRPAVGVQVTGPHYTHTMYFDKESHLLLQGVGSDLLREVVFSEYKTLDGLPIARKENDGIPVFVEVTDFKLEKFDARLFEQP